MVPFAVPGPRGDDVGFCAFAIRWSSVINPRVVKGNNPGGQRPERGEAYARTTRNRSPPLAADPGTRSARKSFSPRSARFRAVTPRLRPSALPSLRKGRKRRSRLPACPCRADRRARRRGPKRENEALMRIAPFVAQTESSASSSVEYGVKRCSAVPSKADPLT
jgi:hypothetical protein